MYIVGYTVNEQNFGVRTWYLGSVWAMTPHKKGSINVFPDHKEAEQIYKKACNDFRRNLKKEFHGGKVWIRKVCSKKNPFNILLSSVDKEKLSLGETVKVGFVLK